MNDLTLVQTLIVWIPPVLFAVTLHEVAHGWAARQLGDRTAEMMGRLTINPVKHIDPVGTILVPLLLYISGGIIFGWARPVPVTWKNLNNPRRDMALVALAGPAANLLMIIFWMIIIKISMVFQGDVTWLTVPLLYMGWAGIIINSVLMILNLLPVPPLDGSRVLSSMLPGPMAWKYNRIEPYGLIILLVLIFTGLLGKIMTPLLQVVEQLVSAGLGL